MTNQLSRSSTLTRLAFLGGFLAIAGCATDDTNGGDPTSFVGSWAYQPGAFTRRTCGTDIQQNTLNGSEELALGTDTPITWLAYGVCEIHFGLDGRTASAIGGQSCHITTNTESGTIAVTTATFTLSADGAVLTDSGEMQVHYSDGRSCVGTFGGTLIR